LRGRRGGGENGQFGVKGGVGVLEGTGYFNNIRLGGGRGLGNWVGWLEVGGGGRG
jgi:hypothetical protein